jgi:hypothetical protein
VPTDCDDPTQLKERKGIVLRQISMLPVVRVADAEHSQSTAWDSAPVEIVELSHDASIAGVDEILLQSRMCALVLGFPHHPS